MAYIPAGRNLVMCFDGTTNQYDGAVCTLLLLFHSHLPQECGECLGLTSHISRRTPMLLNCVPC
jgi:hypothetical protein